MFGRRRLNHLFISILVIVPEATLIDVVHGKFPVLLGIVEAFQKALSLLFLREVQEKLADHDAVTREIAFESVHVFETLFPDALGYQLFRQSFIFQLFGMHPDDQPPRSTSD